MEIKKQFCTQCGKQNIKIVKDNCCNRCYYQQRNKERILEVRRSFNAKTEYNKEIFNLYVNKVLSTYIKNQEPPVVKKFACLLERDAIPVIQCWEDIYELSEKYGIEHSGANKEKRGCPFRKIKKELGVKHSLPNRKYYTIGSLEKYTSRFHEDDIPYVQKYIAQISKKHKLKTSTDLCIRELLTLYESSAPLTLFKIKKEFLVKYFEKFSQNKKWHYSDHFYRLRMFYTWSLEQELISSNPFEGQGVPTINKQCPVCEKIKSFQYKGDICSFCLSMMKNADKISKLSENFRAKTNYNSYLLDLYFKYISRYSINHRHIKVTEKLKEFLRVRSVTTLKNWIDVKKASEDFKKYTGYSSKGSCPFIKIARMLQELNVLPIRQEDYAIAYDHSIERLPASFKDMAILYFNTLKKRKYALTSLVSYANLFDNLQKWLQRYYATNNILNVSELMLIDYFNQIQSEHNTIRSMTTLRKFYKWAKKEKYILINPLEQIMIPKLDPSLLICSDDQIKSLIKYIKNVDVDPEKAMLLGLVLYWGLTGPELRCSTINIVNGLIQIRLYRKDLSYGRKNYRRNNTLVLPDNPAWINGLQKRFINQWEQKYKKVKKNFPNQLLFFTKNLRSNRPIGIGDLRARLYKGTLDATGEKIPLSVLRRTCGHIYSMTGEASILRDLGWSKGYATQFLWRQREYFKDIRDLEIKC